MKVVQEFFKVPIYNYEIELVLTDNILEYCNIQMKDERVEAPMASMYDFYGRANSKIDFLLVLDRSNVKQDVIVHEVVHIASRIMRYIGTPLIEETEEPYAYLHDYLYRIIMNRFIRMKLNLMEIQDGNSNTREEIQETVRRD